MNKIRASKIVNNIAIKLINAQNPVAVVVGVIGCSITVSIGSSVTWVYIDDF